MIADPVEEQISIYAKLLKLPTFAKYTEILRKADQSADFGTLLLELMKNEYLKRKENQNNRRLKQAGFPFLKSIDELDLTRYDGNLSQIIVQELASCQYIADRKNVILFGNTGRGKTHMAIGLGVKACAQGMSVIFENASSLSTKLAEAMDNYMLGKLEKRLQNTDLLILDEMGYVHFDRKQSELLFRTIAKRSELGSIIVTSNLPFSDWTNLFDSAALVAAMVDRLTFKSFIIDMNGESYRLEKTRK